MGDLTWLTGLLTATAGLVGYLVRWIVKRERERALETIQRERQISDQWRKVAETYGAGQQRTNEILGRVLLTLERPPWVATASPGGWSGSAGSDTSRHRQSESPWPR